MIISIYYTAKRKQKLTHTEQEAINHLLEKYSVDEEIDEYLKTGEGHNWTSFSIYDPKNPTASDVIFEGATELPNNSEYAMFDGADHWAWLLEDIRNVIDGAEWDEENLEYDITK